MAVCDLTAMGSDRNVAALKIPHPPPTRSPDKDSPPFFTRVAGSFAHTPRTAKLAWHSARSGLLLVALLVVASAVLPVAVAWVGKVIVDAVVASHRVTGAAHDAAVAKVWHWVLVEAGLVVGMAFIERTVGLVRQLVGSRLAIDLAVMIMKKALTLDLRHFEDATFYDKLTRARREASSSLHSSRMAPQASRMASSSRRWVSARPSSPACQPR